MLTHSLELAQKEKMCGPWEWVWRSGAPLPCAPTTGTSEALGKASRRGDAMATCREEGQDATCAHQVGGQVWQLT